MHLRKLGVLAAGLGFCLSTEAATPDILSFTKKTESTNTDKASKASNQQLADTVVKELTKTPGLIANVSLDVTSENGSVSLKGVVKSAEQKSAILEVVSLTNGVTLVRDGIVVKAPQEAPTLSMAPAMTPAQQYSQAQAFGGPFVAQAPTTTPPAGRPMGDPQIDPVPVGHGGGAEMGAPHLPPYAWPTYAPYNNVSRVAYPTAYPYQAFPFIGPYYPFPKIPLGWRKVTLEWEDGHWWLGRKQAPMDYWRVKFGY